LANLKEIFSLYGTSFTLKMITKHWLVLYTYSPVPQKYFKNIFDRKVQHRILSTELVAQPNKNGETKDHDIFTSVL